MPDRPYLVLNKTVKLFFLVCIWGICALTWSETNWNRKDDLHVVQRVVRAGCVDNGGSKQGSSYKELQKSASPASG